MKKILLITLLSIGFLSCGINRQAQQIKALEQCQYKLINATQVSLAGSDVKKMIEQKSFNLSNLPGLALGYLRKDIPLKANLNLEISNPSSALAAINNFEFIILVNKQEIATGLVNQQVSVAPGQSVNVPVQLQANVYQFVSNGKILDDISSFISGAAQGDEKKGMVTLKIKPSIKIGNELVKYPGYITIDKEVSSKILL